MDADRAVNALQGRRGTSPYGRGTDSAGPHRARLLPGYGADCGSGGRHPGARRRSRHQVDSADDGRSQRGLELYLNVPVQRAPQLRLGLPVRFARRQREGARQGRHQFRVTVGGHGNPGPSWSKVAVASNSGFRTSQYVRSQVIWSTTPTLTVAGHRRAADQRTVLCVRGGIEPSRLARERPARRSSPGSARSHLGM